MKAICESLIGAIACSGLTAFQVYLEFWPGAVFCGLMTFWTILFGLIPILKER